MGKKQSKKLDLSLQDDVQLIRKFLGGSSSLDELWDQFDSNGDGEIDEDELKYLVTVSLTFFCKMRCPDRPEPCKKDMESQIQSVFKQVQHYVDVDNDKLITKKEFERYGAYLRNEYKKLRSELEGDCKIEE